MKFVQSFLFSLPFIHGISAATIGFRDFPVAELNSDLEKRKDGGACVRCLLRAPESVGYVSLIVASVLHSREPCHRAC